MRDAVKSQSQHNPPRCASQCCSQCRCKSHFLSFVPSSRAMSQLWYSRTYLRHVLLSWHLVHHELLVLDGFLDLESRCFHGVSKCRTFPHQCCEMAVAAELSLHNRNSNVQPVSCHKSKPKWSTSTTNTAPWSSEALVFVASDGAPNQQSKFPHCWPRVDDQIATLLTKPSSKRISLHSSATLHVFAGNSCPSDIPSHELPLKCVQRHITQSPAR